VINSTSVIISDRRPSWTVPLTGSTNVPARRTQASTISLISRELEQADGSDGLQEAAQGCGTPIVRAVSRWLRRGRDTDTCLGLRALGTPVLTGSPVVPVTGSPIVLVAGGRE